MNQDVFEGKWKEMRGQIKEWWGKLTDDDLEQVSGKADQMVGLLQQKYDYTREQIVNGVVPYGAKTTIAGYYSTENGSSEWDEK